MKSAEPEETRVLAALMEVCEGTSVTITHLNHLKGRGAFTSGCVHTGAEGWSRPSEEAAHCEALGVQSPLGSAFPVGCPLQWGLEGSGDGKESAGLWGHELSTGMEKEDSQQSQVFALQGALLVQWHRDVFYWSTPLWSDSGCYQERFPGAPGISSRAMTTMMQEGQKPYFSSCRREITYLFPEVSHSVVT